MSLNLKCPRCGQPMVRCTAWSGAESEFWYKCSRAPKCNTYFNSFKPLPHQASVLSDNHKFILNAGGFGSAKTYTTRQLIYKQLFLSPKATVLVGANVMSQYEQTIKRELEADIPKEFVKKYNTQKQYMELQNGARIVYRPLDDVDKLRSMNLSAFFIIEGSEVSPDAFTQLKSRLRNMAAAHKSGKTYDYFRGKGVVETNPDSGWVRSEMLDVSEVIKHHGTANKAYLPGPNPDKAVSTHISSSDANPYLPANYIRDLCAGKPKWWVDRYVYGSFEFANGLVCPKYKDAIVPTFTPPKEWVKLIGHDPGLIDASAFVNIAIDDKQGIAYVYRDHQYHDLGVAELYERWVKEIAYDINATEFYTQPVMDGKMHGRRMFTDKNTLDQMWASYGVHFQPGHIPVLDRVWRLNTYLETGRLKIMDCCENLLRELPEYKWAPCSLKGSSVEKPVDKNNHSIDAMQFALMELPEDPKKLILGAYTGFGSRLDTNRDAHKKQVMWMFSENNPEPADEYTFTMEGDF